MLVRKIIISIGLIWLVVISAKSQAPSSWTINANDYENSMVVTAIVNIQNTNSNDGQDVVAAFVGNEVRGVANVNVVKEGADYKLAFMTIYSEQVGGEEVTFKVYNKAENKVYDAVTKLLFKKDENYGSVNAPQLITDNNAPTDISLSNSEVNENAAEGTIVGAFTSEDLDAGDEFTYQLVDGEGAENNVFFAISGTNLVVSNKTIDYETNSELKIRVQSLDPRSGSFEKAFTIKVKNLIDKPTGINLSKSNIDENVKVGTVIARLTTDDEDEDDEFRYQLVEGVGSEDNGFVRINGDTLFTNNSLNFEEKAQVIIRIKTTDKTDASFEKSFTIDVNDLNEIPTDIVLDSESIEENEPIGTVVATLSTVDEDTEETFVYEFVEPENQLFEIKDNKLLSKIEFDYERLRSSEINIKVTDKANQAFEKSFVINIIDVPEQELSANNFISPNNDGKNDVFFITNIEIYQGYVLKIYDASGVKVYSAENYQNNWSGTAKNGEPLPVGVYYYVFRNSSGAFQYQGKITLMK